MIINCVHRSGQRCNAGHYGGRPSNGVCQMCPHRQPTVDSPMFLARPPLPIPDDFDVEHERRRTRAGGCCGAPAKD